MKLNFTIEDAEKVIRKLSLTSNLNLQTFCDAIGYSRHHIARNYYEKFGEYFCDTVGRVRCDTLVDFAVHSNMTLDKSSRRMDMNSRTAIRAMEIFHGKSFITVRKDHLSNLNH